MCVISWVAIFSKGGHEVPDGRVPDFIVVIHEPGLWVSEWLFGHNDFAGLLLGVGLTGLELSGLACLILLAWDARVSK